MPTENISYDCDSGNYSITAIPSAGQSGSTSITISDKVTGSMAGWMKSDCGKQLCRSI
jgi:hypothetical protein